MLDEYEELENILKELEDLEDAKKFIPKVKKKVSVVDNNYVGKKFNMLYILEKTDKRSNNRRYII